MYCTGLMFIFGPPFRHPYSGQRLLLVHLVNTNSPQSLVRDGFRPCKSFTILRPQLQPRLGSTSTTADRGLAPLLPYCAVIPSSPPANCRGLINLLNHPRLPSRPSGHVFPPKYVPQTGLHRNCRFTYSSVNTSVTSHSLLLLLHLRAHMLSLRPLCLLFVFSLSLIVSLISPRASARVCSQTQTVFTPSLLCAGTILSYKQTTSIIQSHRDTANCSIQLAPTKATTPTAVFVYRVLFQVLTY